MGDRNEIVIETKTGFVKSEIMQIVIVRSKERRSEVLLASGRKIESIWTIKKWKEQLPENTFIETHRGVIVNLEYVSEVENERIILLDGAEEEYLSKRKYHEFKQEYQDYMNGNV